MRNAVAIQEPRILGCTETPDWESTTGHEADRVRKDMMGLFKKLGLRITIDTNLKVVNFLDLTWSNGEHNPSQTPSDI